MDEKLWMKTGWTETGRTIGNMIGKGDRGQEALWFPREDDQWDQFQNFGMFEVYGSLMMKRWETE